MKIEKEPEMVSDLILISYYVIAYIVKNIYLIKKFITNNFWLFAIALLSIGCFDLTTCHLSSILYRNVTEFVNYQIYKDNFIKIRCPSNHIKGSLTNEIESIIHNYGEENAKNLKLVFTIIVLFILFDKLYKSIVYLAKLVKLIGQQERGELSEMIIFIFLQIRLIVLIFLSKILVRSLLGSIGFIGLQIENHFFSQLDSKILNQLFELIDKFKQIQFDLSSLVGFKLNDLIEYLDLELKSNVQIDNNLTFEIIQKLNNEKLNLGNVKFLDFFVIFLNYNLELFYSLFLILQLFFIILLFIELILFATKIQKFLSTDLKSDEERKKCDNNKKDTKKVLKTENNQLNDKCKETKQISSADSSTETDLNKTQIIKTDSE